MSKYFITGTDTDAGKTVVAAGLLARAAQQGLRSVGLKPIAAGCELTEQGLRNDDALALMAASTEVLAYEVVNPVALEPAIAPHIVLMKQNRHVSVSQLAGYVRGAMMTPADLVLVEGAGGWRVPLNRREMLSALAKELEVPAILVVGVKLGCINHALLAAESIRADGVELAGWVGNVIDADTECLDENLMTLNALLQAPCLGVVPHLADCSAPRVAEYLTLPTDQPSADVS
ncbi:dethiobiotin synthetase [Sinobacterium caligoides]|uniref:ATP-dependent dethiobiotin synthetase BioD n=1 Tax=Sinobacterium caligoides TaxID=933926 RepID=A0A3N2DQ26_9GAMM|nr:dethiobiotin synthase [Sinobacterium caligoides]ROS01931.1 dethiobiotin synthetase [Sinobacterium caligoides]